MFTWLTKLRLQTRVSLLVFLGLMLIFAFMAWQGRQIADANTQMVLQERLTVAHVVAQHLDQDLERTLSRLAQVAASPAINLEDSDLEPEKAELRALYRPDYFSYVFLLDKDGLVLWTEPYLPDVVNREHLECPHVQETLRTGQPAIACVVHALTPLSPVIAPVVPIRDRQGAIVGALGAAIDPSSPPFVQIFQGMAPGNTGYIQLVDENGIVLAHTEHERLFQKSEHADLVVPLLKGKRAAIATYTVTEENRGTFSEVIAFAPLTSAAWGVTVEQDEAEFLALSTEASRRMMIFAVIAIAGALLLAWLTTRSVTQPVRKLVIASARIAAGDLATPVPPLGEDEIGELGKHFEKMRLRLASWGEELETAVQKRTRELSTLYAIDRAAAQSLELDEILNDSLDKVLEVLEVEAGGIYLLEPDGETMTLRVHRELSDEFVRNAQRIKLGEGISGRAAAEKKPVVLDVSDYPTERLAPYIIQEGFQTLASTPLLSTGQLVGALNLATRRPRAFPPEELDLLTAIGRQLGGAVQNARLYQETRRTRDYLQNVLDSSLDLIFTIKPDGTFGYSNPRLTEITGYDAESIRGRPFLDFIPEDRRAFMLQKWQEITRGIGGTYETEIISANGQRIPVLVSHSVIEGFDEYLAILRDISSLKETERALEQRAERLSLLNHIAHALSTTLNLDELLEIVYREITTTIPAETFFVALYDRAANELDYRIRVDKGIREPLERRPMTTGLTSTVVTSKQPLLIRDFEKEKEHLPSAQLWGTMQAPPSWLGAPMLLGDQVVGAISVQAYRPNAYGEAEQELLSTIADAVAVAIENARLYEREKQLAQYLRSLNDAVARAMRGLDVQAVVQTVVKCLIEQCGAAFARVWLTDESGEYLILRGSAGLYTRLDGSRARVSIADDPHKLGIIARERKPLITNQVQQETYFDTAWAQREGLVAFAGYPILAEDKLLGVVALFSRQPLGAEMLDVLGTFVNQVEVVLTNARLYEAEQRRAARLAALQRLGIELAALREESAVLNTLVARTATIAESPACTVMLVDETTNEAVLAAQTGLPEGTPLGLRVPLTLPIIRRSLETGEPLIVPDIDRDAPALRTILVRQDVRAFFAFPMAREGRTLGFITLSSLAPRTPSKEEITAYRLLAERAAAALENARLFKETTRRAEQQQALYHISTALARLDRPQELCRVVVREVQGKLGYPYLGIFLVEPETGDRVLQAQSGVWDGAPRDWRLHPGEGISERAILTGELQYWSDVAREPRYIPGLPGSRSEVDVPIKIGESILGVLIVEETRVDAFGADDFVVLQSVANQLAAALENARLYQGLEESKTALEAKVRDLERFTRLAVGRELRMKELKEKMRELEEQGSKGAEEQGGKGAGQ